MTDDRLQARLAAFRAAFDAGIGAQGVKWPENSRYKWGLMLMWEHLGQPFTQDDLLRFYTEHGLGSYDRQIRHMAAAGWYLESSSTRASNMRYNPEFPNNSVALKSISQPNPIQSADRTKEMPRQDWEALVAWFETHRGGCAMCGTRCDSYDRGHLSRRQAATDENIAPLCAPCNNWLQAMDLDAYLEDRTLIVRPLLPGTDRYNKRLMKRHAQARRQRPTP